MKQKMQNVYLPMTSVLQYTHTKLPHEKLLDIIFQLIDFFSRRLQNINGSTKRKVFFFFFKVCIVFTCNSLKTTLKNLIENWFFTVGNIALTQDIGIPMDIDPVTFWEIIFGILMKINS